MKSSDIRACCHQSFFRNHVFRPFASRYVLYVFNRLISAKYRKTKVYKVGIARVIYPKANLVVIGHIKGCSAKLQFKFGPRTPFCVRRNLQRRVTALCHFVADCGRPARFVIIVLYNVCAFSFIFKSDFRNNLFFRLFRFGFNDFVYQQLNVVNVERRSVFIRTVALTELKLKSSDIRACCHQSFFRNHVFCPFASRYVLYVFNQLISAKYRKTKVYKVRITRVIYPKANLVIIGHIKRCSAELQFKFGPVAVRCMRRNLQRRVTALCHFIADCRRPAPFIIVILYNVCAFSRIFKSDFRNNLFFRFGKFGLSTFRKEEYVVDIEYRSIRIRRQGVTN